MILNILKYKPKWGSQRKKLSKVNKMIRMKVTDYYITSYISFIIIFIDRYKYKFLKLI